ncbi:rRNA maturation RNase YbeY [bacterium]|nr:MAG: rRNA maturation RNase YbeY [bacterium]
MAGRFSVFSSRKSYRREERGITVLGGKLSKILGKENIGLEVYLISDREMRVLNRRFLGKDKTTNVLSFTPTPESRGRKPMVRGLTAARDPFRPDFKKNTRYLGEIFLAPDYARARKEKLGRLFTHGFLHLLGYTHGRKRDRIKMEKLEDRLSQRTNT